MSSKQTVTPTKLIPPDYQDCLRLIIEEHMERAVLTPAKLAHAAGIRPDVLARNLKGKRGITIALLQKLAPVLGTTAGELSKEAKYLCE